MKYKKCEKCGLNYVKSGTICQLCQKDAKQTTDKKRVLCPFCYERYMDKDEIMCNHCLRSDYFSENID